MEGLELNAIPIRLLARMMIQIPTLPPNSNHTDLLSIITAGLKEYGHTSDLNAFLDYCKTNVFIDPWSWQHYAITSEHDWDRADHKKDQQVVGLRFLIDSETERQRIQLTRWSKSNAYDPKCVQFYRGRAIPIDCLLKDTLHYFEKQTIQPALEKLIQLRLTQYAEDTDKYNEQTSQLDHADYDLVGALMVRYDSTPNRGYASDAWCLYLRDFIETSDGSSWRVLYDEQDQKISSDQAMADIQGVTKPNQIQPTDFSKDYRPVYVFYVNLDVLQPKEDHVITLEDYTLDDPNSEEHIPCMHCGIAEIADDINDMFFCESCHQGVHQLCEDPPIQSFEVKIDPWYCRTCCRVKNLPLENVSLKRKREE
ncbi:hypothetical protein BD560DRAFT_387618 [Blakeslea trispora]|nr:hypothetical protein BD560DRAFT_387618 [Blakeslea trispora]